MMEVFSIMRSPFLAAPGASDQGRLVVLSQPGAWWGLF